MTTQSEQRELRFIRPAAALNGLVALLAGGLAFGVYYFTLAPTVTGEDSGELIAAAFTLGIPHPPGYPLWCLLAKGFITLIPAGEVAWRAALLSATCGALTVALVALIVILLTDSRLAGFAAALALGFSREFWEQSVIAEVYTLNALFTALCVYLLFRWTRDYKKRFLYGFAFTFGLSLANHSTMLLLLPVFAAYVVVFDLEFKRAGQYAAMIGFGLLGLLPYLYLPIRALADPPMNWGDPSSWQGFWDVVSRTQYQHMVTDGPRDALRVLWQSWTFAKIYAWEFTPWVGVLALLGVPRLWRDQRGVCNFLVAIFLVVALGAILIPNFDLEHHAIWMNTTFWIPAYVIAAIFLGVTLATLLQVTSLPRSVRAAMALVVVMSPLVTHARHNDMRAPYAARDYAQNLLDTMAPEAVYYGSGDHTVFPMLYLQIVEGQRPDVTILNKYGYPEAAAYAELPAEARPAATGTPSKADTDRLFEWLLAEGSRPVYSTIRRPAGTRTVVGEGLLYRYLSETEVRPAAWPEYAWHDLESENVHDRWTTALVLFEYHLARGRAYFDADEPAQAAVSLLSARDLIREDKHALNNLGILAAEYGEFELAAAFLESALETDPDFALSHLNLGRTYLELGRRDAAQAEFESALTLDPTNMDAERWHKKTLRGADASQ